MILPCFLSIKGEYMNISMGSDNEVIIPCMKKNKQVYNIFENIGFNTVPTDPFMSHLATQLGYSAGEFQALQLIVLATFGVVD